MNKHPLQHVVEREFGRDIDPIVYPMNILHTRSQPTIFSPSPRQLTGVYLAPLAFQTMTRLVPRLGPSSMVAGWTRRAWVGGLHPWDINCSVCYWAVFGRVPAYGIAQSTGSGTPLKPHQPGIRWL